MASATVATPSTSTPSTNLVAVPSTPSTARRGSRKPSKSRKPSRQSSPRSVRINLGGAEASLAVGVNSGVNNKSGGSNAIATAIAVGLRSRSHTSREGEAIAVGMAALAEITGNAFFACAVGAYPKAVSHCQGGGAFAIGDAPEANALGEGGVAVAIADGDGGAIVSAGPGGLLVIVMLANKRDNTVFQQRIDGREFRVGRRYTIDNFGLWSEVVDGEEPITEIDFDHPASQVETTA